MDRRWRKDGSDARTRYGSCPRRRLQGFIWSNDPSANYANVFYKTAIDRYVRLAAGTQVDLTSGNATAIDIKLSAARAYPEP